LSQPSLTASRARERSSWQIRLTAKGEHLLQENKLGETPEVLLRAQDINIADALRRPLLVLNLRRCADS
jgi:hypothetical protein